MSDLDHLMSLVIHEAKSGRSEPKKKSVFLPPGATVYNENFAKSYPPFDKSKVEKYDKGTRGKLAALTKKSKQMGSTQILA